MPGAAYTREEFGNQVHTHADVDLTAVRRAALLSARRYGANPHEAEDLASLVVLEAVERLAPNSRRVLPLRCRNVDRPFCVLLWARNMARAHTAHLRARSKQELLVLDC